MKKIIITLALLTLTACSSPTDIVFGPEPLKQMAEQSEKFSKLPEQDRMLLVGYLSLNEMSKAFGGKGSIQVTGRTVGEVLVEAKAWKAKQITQEAEAKKKEAETAALQEKALAERKAISDKLGQVVVVALTGKIIRPQDYQAGRLYDVLLLQFAVENKADKPIQQLKGLLHVLDATGDEIGMLAITFEEPIGAHATVKTDTGSGWKIQRFNRGNIEKIADASFAGMKSTFEVEAIAYSDGEVLRVPKA